MERIDRVWSLEKKCRVGSLLKTKQSCISWPLGSNPFSCSVGRDCPRSILLLISFPISSRAKALALPPSPSPRPLYPLFSSLPFSISLPFPPCQDVIKSKAGSGSPPSSPKIPPREPQSVGKSKVERGEGRSQSHPPGRRESGSRPGGSRASPTWTPAAADLAPCNKGSLSAREDICNSK